MWWFALVAGLVSITVALSGQDAPLEAQASPLGLPSVSTTATSRADGGPSVVTAAPDALPTPPVGAPGDGEQPAAQPDDADADADGDDQSPADRTDDHPEADRGDEAPSSDQGADPAAAASRAGEDPEPVVNDGPASVSIPTIGVTSVLNHLGLNSDGTLEVPARGPHYDEAAWFHGSPEPGDVGPAVLLGHVNGTGGTPSVFYHLDRLSEGDLVTVTAGDGSTSTFEVYRTDRYPKDEFPTMSVYGDTAGPELRLITCGGLWDSTTGHYRDNTVVYARVVTS